MKMYSALVSSLILGCSLLAGNASATALFSTSGSLTAADPTQLGRLSRNGIFQTWDGAEAFPGTINPTNSYHFHAYTINVGNSPYVEITFDSTAATTFISAYQSAYSPGTSLQLNWLGDTGSSGNTFSGTNPLSFQVIAQANSALVIVVNETTTNGGLGLAYGITADGFINSNYDEFTPRVVPEPATLLLLAPLALLAVRKRRGAAARSDLAVA